jgi:hypothetical protein
MDVYMPGHDLERSGRVGEIIARVVTESLEERGIATVAVDK